MNDHKHISMNTPEPKTDVPRAIRRSFINWLVPTLCLALIMACFLVVQNWADGRYTTRATMDSEESAIRKSLADEQSRRENLEQTVGKMDRKLDLIIYIMQRDGKIDQQGLKQIPP